MNGLTWWIVWAVAVGVLVGLAVDAIQTSVAETVPTPAWTCEPSADGLHERCYLDGWDD